MQPPCSDIKDILRAELGMPDALVHLSRLPETPHELIAVLDQSGMAPEDLIAYYKPMVQVMIRGNKGQYANTYATAQNIRNLLHGYGATEVNSTWYIGIWATSDILPLGYDSLERPVFSLNFLIHRSEMEGT